MNANDAPLTCEWCGSSPATEVFAVDYRHIGRHTALVCSPCGDRGEPDARRVAGLVWRYALAPLTTTDTKPSEVTA